MPQEEREYEQQHAYYGHAWQENNGMYLAYWQALWLLTEIELEAGSPDGLLLTLTRLQVCCSTLQAMLERGIAASSAGSQTIWYKPWTWLGGVMQGEDTKVYLSQVHAPLSPLRVSQPCSILARPLAY